MGASAQDPSAMDAAALEEHATSTISELTPDKLDGVTKDKGFRQATAMLLFGKITVPEWEWFAIRALNKRLDIPYIGEAAEKDLLAEAFEAVGLAMEGLLLTSSSEFRTATVDLLRGEATVDDWIDVAGEALDAIIDIPYVPAIGEDLLFDRGLELIAKSLHGLLVGSSEDAQANE